MLSGGSNPKMVGFINPNRPNSGFHCIMPADNDWTFAPTGKPGIFLTINDDAWRGSDQLWIYDCMSIGQILIIQPFREHKPYLFPNLAAILEAQLGMI